MGNIFRFPDRDAALTLYTKERAGYLDTVSWPIDRITPVPIVQEWLARLGFSPRPPIHNSALQNAVFLHATGSKHYGIGFHNNALQIFAVPNYSDQADVIEATPTSIILTYVHELQNFWFDHTGEQLIDSI